MAHLQCLRSAYDVEWFLPDPNASSGLSFGLSTTSSPAAKLSGRAGDVRKATILDSAHSRFARYLSTIFGFA